MRNKFIAFVLFFNILAATADAQALNNQEIGVWVGCTLLGGGAGAGLGYTLASEVIDKQEGVVRLINQDLDRKRQFFQDKKKFWQEKAAQEQDEQIDAMCKERLSFYDRQLAAIEQEEAALIEIAKKSHPLLEPDAKKRCIKNNICIGGASGVLISALVVGLILNQEIKQR